MLTGAHVVIYSTGADADRAFLRDVVGLPHLDIGGGWLLFALPPAEVAFHPAEKNDAHELYLLCEDIASFISGMAERGVECGAPQDLPWGRRTTVPLPGGGRLGVYQPLHEVIAGHRTDRQRPGTE